MLETAASFYFPPASGFLTFPQLMGKHGRHWTRMFKPDREKDRYYLLPGMGGRALRRKQKVILSWSAVAGLLVAVLLGLAIYLMNTR